MLHNLLAAGWRDARFIELLATMPFLISELIFALRPGQYWRDNNNSRLAAYL